jgi:hypothetical protein
MVYGVGNKLYTPPQSTYEGMAEGDARIRGKLYGKKDTPHMRSIFRVMVVPTPVLYLAANQFYI